MVTDFLARIIDLEPSAALSLFQVSNRFFQSACKSAFEELSVYDDVHCLTRPPRKSKLDLVLQKPDRKCSRIAFPNFCSFMARSVPGLSVLIISPQVPLGRCGNAPAEQHTTSISSASSSPRSALGSLLLESPLATEEDEKEDASQPVELSSRWDCFGIHTLPCLRELSLSHLSREGVKNLTAALPYLPHIEFLTLDFQFVDDTLLSGVSESCKKVANLTIRTSGTKMTDKGILAIFQGCNDLRSLTLSEVEGRLSKGIWSKIDSLPDSFKSFTYVMNETGPHHS
ncbi:hypothetical protein IE53DRAFT_177932 [Violaceomyces palustris]|uniref:Uncharacterized protein n=1 Tax=Violaceomyces palustris TaxID=1673888 RepID=A0ACD0NSI5_9BASI|nr:hypothetical protein IE53DRAFT_177932 [Violaceomyces palustris]